ncbi:tyrosine-type recombinase/integrase [Joostella sp.]|uniref:tyrosine-type recombinase/integrase n=1 Tax=Joostella sp. TaxID=2231138 RepID=UPI003A8FB1C0
MATIKFYPYKPKEKSKIYIRLFKGKNLDVRLSTGLSILRAENWDYKKGFPKKNSESNKELHNSLKELESHIENEILNIEKSSNENSHGLSSKWLKSLIDVYFNEGIPVDRELLVEYSKFYAEELKSKTFIRNGVKKKYKQETINKYVNFARHIKEFQDYSGRKLYLKDVDLGLCSSFLEYITDIKGLSINTTGRFAKRLKTIVGDAESKRLPVNVEYRKIKGFEDDTIVVYLTLDEIDRIIEANVSNAKLGICKDWLVIGCYTGQRISDLFRMQKKDIIEIQGINFISIKQFKTGKKVNIPIHYKVKGILKKYDGAFPPNLSENEKSNRTALSKGMKEVCKAAEINEITRGRYNGKLGNYPKWKLIQNHSCRRSFATNFYGKEGWSTPMIMEITGHETERNFYRYIDKENFELSIQAAKNFEMMEMNDSLKEKKLKSV